MDHGWLDTWHTFSFASYYNPDRMHFGALRVLNDDTVQPGMGFGTHPHDNMEIITIVLDGELEHRDSMGNGSVIHPGEIQVMSAGTGIQHSEFNHSTKNKVSFLQIWVFPDKKNVEPRYGQAKFDEQEIAGKWRTIVSPDGVDQSVWIHQQAWFSLGNFDEGSTISYKPQKSENGVYLFLISGEVEVGAEKISDRYGLCIEEIDSEIDLKITKNSKVLLMEVPL
jgi:redox-sensitive bicupin YhaK (pirin superfamily)